MQSVVAFKSPGGWLALFWATLLSGPSTRTSCWPAMWRFARWASRRNFVDILLVQTLVMFLLYFAPTPGASGVGEVLSAAVMSSYVPRELTPIYILIWRLTLSYFTLAFGFFVFSGWVRQGPEGDRRGRAGRTGTGGCPDERALRTNGPDRGYDAALLRRLLVYLRPYRLARTPGRSCSCSPARAWRWSGRRSPSARSTSPFPHHDTGLLGTLAALFLAALLLDFVVDYGQRSADRATSASG